MELKIIPQDIDKKDKSYSSADCQQLISIYETYYPQVGYHPPWVGYFIFANNVVAGSCGFTGEPKENKVEIAYWTFKEFEGRGIASFACKELVSIALKANPGIIITAKTLPEFNASTKILQKNGFICSAIVQDHEIGDAWFWTFSA